MNAIIDAGAKMDINPYKPNVATSQCALNYTGSSFAGGKSPKKVNLKKATTKKATTKKATLSKK